MKRLSGGQVLLNLTAISLGLTSGEVSITDTGILGELTELRNFIDVNRDFSKGFKNLKPVLIEYRSSASKFNGIALANLSFNTDALHMSIGANTIQDDGKMLVITINVVYEWVDYIGYQVKTAKLNAYETLATGDGTFTGDVGVGGDLSVTGDASVGGDLSVTGDVEVDADSKVKVFENIVDKAGNKRFIEGDLVTEEIEGITFTYGKWSLSGSHLMIVLAGNGLADTAITSGQTLASTSGLPAWIISKIYPTFNAVITAQNFDAWDSGYNKQVMLEFLNKETTTLRIFSESFTFSSDKSFRIAFDLLIDDEYE